MRRLASAVSRASGKSCSGTACSGPRRRASRPRPRGQGPLVDQGQRLAHLARGGCPRAEARMRKECSAARGQSGAAPPPPEVSCQRFLRARVEVDIGVADEERVPRQLQQVHRREARACPRVARSPRRHSAGASRRRRRCRTACRRPGPRTIVAPIRVPLPRTRRRHSRDRPRRLRSGNRPRPLRAGSRRRSSPPRRAAGLEPQAEIADLLRSPPVDRPGSAAQALVHDHLRRAKHAVVLALGEHDTLVAWSVAAANTGCITVPEV